jgi:alkylated DNA nucleotide flippase Atl1
MDTDKLRTVLEAIPEGRWMSYSDVVLAAGAEQAAARRLNQRLIRDDLPNAHRVLMADGRVALTALGDPEGVRDKLVAEGVTFDDRGRAAADQRWLVRLPAESDPDPEPEAATAAS